MSHGARSANRDACIPIVLRLPLPGEACPKISADPQSRIGGMAMRIHGRCSPGCSRLAKRIFRLKGMMPPALLPSNGSVWSAEQHI